MLTPKNLFRNISCNPISVDTCESFTGWIEVLQSGQFTWKLVVPFPPRVFDWEFFFFPFLLNCIVVKFFSSWSVVSGSSAIELWTLSSFCPQSFFSSTESANYFMLFIILNFACHLKLKRMLPVRFAQLYFSPPHTVFLCTYSYISIFFVEVIKLYSI